MDKKEYVNKINLMLSDDLTYKLLLKDPINASLKSLNTFVLELYKQQKISKYMYYHLRCSKGVTPSIYGVPKIHKPEVPLRPIVAFIGSPTYNLSKFIAKRLSPLVGNTPHHVKNSYEFKKFAENIVIEDNEIMVSFDVVSLFTNVPIDLALTCARLCLENAEYNDDDNWSIDEICVGLKLCLESTYFRFQDNFYQQIFGTATGSPVSVVVANMVLENIECNALKYV